MAQEIELKLAIPVRQAPTLRQHPLLSELPSRKSWVHNSYLDTPDQKLRQQRIAVRRRCITGTWLLTVKTAAKSVQELSIRNEWEYPMPPEQLDFSLIDNLSVRQTLEAIQHQLTPAFQTDFVRQTWDIPMDDAHIELALDLGHIRHGNVKTRIAEIELELVNGAPECLEHIGHQLSATLPLTPLDQSKAARGYALLNSL